MLTLRAHGQLMDALRNVKKSWPDVPCFVLCIDVDRAAEAMKAGATSAVRAPRTTLAPPIFRRRKPHHTNSQPVLSGGALALFHLFGCKTKGRFANDGFQGDSHLTTRALPP